MDRSDRSAPAGSATSSQTGQTGWSSLLPILVVNTNIKICQNKNCRGYPSTILMLGTSSNSDYKSFDFCLEHCCFTEFRPKCRVSPVLKSAMLESDYLQIMCVNIKMVLNQSSRYDIPLKLSIQALSLIWLRNHSKTALIMSGS